MAESLLPPCSDDEQHPPPPPSVLGVPTENLAGLSVDEVCGNKVAVTMVLHYYKQLVDQNRSLKNQLNTANSYVDAYKAKKFYTIVGGLLFIASNIGIGFGVNLLTSGQTSAGWSTLIPGAVFAIFGTVLTFRNGEA